MSRLERTLRRHRDDHAGFTLVEVMVTTAILLIVAAVTFRLVVALEEQQQSLSATLAGERQSELSSMAVVQYIRSGYQLESASGTSLTLDSYIGTSPGAFNPNAGHITISFVPGGGGSPPGTGVLTMSVQGLSGVPPTTTGSSSNFETADVVAPAGSGAAVFTYYAYIRGARPAVEKVANPTKCLGDIVAVGIHMTFLANSPPRAPASLSSLATTLNTTVYLRNASGDTGVTGSTGVTGNTGVVTCA